jgi:hypothetical protein
MMGVVGFNSITAYVHTRITRRSNGVLMGTTVRACRGGYPQMAKQFPPLRVQGLKSSISRWSEHLHLPLLTGTHRLPLHMGVAGYMVVVACYGDTTSSSSGGHLLYEYTLWEHLGWRRSQHLTAARVVGCSMVLYGAAATHGRHL